MLGSLLLVLPLGCAQNPDLKLRVESARVARLAPEVRHRLEEGDAGALREIDADLGHRQQRVANAKQALSAARAEPVTSEAAEVHAAKVERADCELKWEEALLRAAEWRRASAASATELAKAETLSRAGDDIDVSAYAEQHERMRAGLAEAQRQQAATRTRFDESERRLSAAKARYAEGKVHAAAAGPTRQ
jgi:hypothetical protein